MTKPSLFKRILRAVFKDTPTVKTVGFSTEPASQGVNSHKQLFDSTLRTDSISHKDVNNLAKTLFNTEIESNMFCFRSGGPYGLVLGINSVHVSRSNEGQIDDIVFVMKDCSFGTSMEVIISVKDLKEMLRPFHLKLPTRTN